MTHPIDDQVLCESGRPQFICCFSSLLASLRSVEVHTREPTMSPSSIPPTPPGPPHSQQQQQLLLQAHLPHEERLSKAWRTMGTAVAGVLQKAEKAGSEPTVDRYRDLDKGVVLFLQARMEFHRLLSHVEAKLRGKAEELESSETYVRTQPRLGGSRKRRKLDDEARLRRELEQETLADEAAAAGAGAGVAPHGDGGDVAAPVVIDESNAPDEQTVEAGSASYGRDGSLGVDASTTPDLPPLLL